MLVRNRPRPVPFRFETLGAHAILHSAYGFMCHGVLVDIGTPDSYRQAAPFMARVRGPA